MFGQVTEVRVESTSETRDVAGYSCRKYVLTLGQSFQFDIWAAPG